MNKATEYLRFLSVRRIVSVGLVFLGQWMSFILKRPVVLAKPYVLTIESVCGCNLRCPGCIAGARTNSNKTGLINSELFRKIIDETTSALLACQLYFLGEPTLHPQLAEMITYLRSRRVFPIVSTNGNLISEELARSLVDAGTGKIIFSLDGASQETYGTYRKGGDFEKVVSGIRNVIQAKKTAGKFFPEVEIQFIVFRHNEDELEEVRRLASSLGADFRLKSAYLSMPGGEDRIPINGKYSRYFISDGKMQIKSNHSSFCKRLWNNSVVRWDGKVYPCCFDKNEAFCLGDLSKNSFMEVWKGDEYNNFRRNILNNRRTNTMCLNCTEGLKTKV